MSVLLHFSLPFEWLAEPAVERHAIRVSLKSNHKHGRAMRSGSTLAVSWIHRINTVVESDCNIVIPVHPTNGVWQ